MVEFQGHDYHNCGCLRCTRLREQEQRENEKFKREHPEQHKAIQQARGSFIALLIALPIFLIIGFYIWEGYGATIFFVLWIFALIHWFRKDLSKISDTENS